jgi:hypothetical protein
MRVADKLKHRNLVFALQQRFYAGYFRVPTMMKSVRDYLGLAG